MRGTRPLYRKQSSLRTCHSWIGPLPINPDDASGVGGDAAVESYQAPVHYSPTVSASPNAGIKGVCYNTLNSQRFACLCLLSAEMKGVCHRHIAHSPDF